MYDICDLHSHILPAMDDGCATVEESAAVLQKMLADGVEKVFSTPHYYARESVEEFLLRRDQSLQQLLAHMKGEEMPQICCGAEVAWFPGIGNCPQIEKLCLGSSRYLLLELPFTPWSALVVRDVNNLCLRGMIPILAHFERYSSCQTKEARQKLLQTDALVQINAGSVLDFWQSFAVCDAFKKGSAHLLGSDCHGLNRRPARLAEAVGRLEKKKLYGALAEMEALSNEIFREARI